MKYQNHKTVICSPRYLASLKLEQSSVLDMWGGVQYLPLEAESFLGVQSLVNRAQVEFDEVQSCLFLHQGQLVWSEINPDLTRLLGNIYIHFLYPINNIFSSLPDNHFVTKSHIFASSITNFTSSRKIPCGWICDRHSSSGPPGLQQTPFSCCLPRHQLHNLSAAAVSAI